MEVERLEEGGEGRIRALLAHREIAAIDNTDLDHHPSAHTGNTDDAAQDSADEVNNKQVCRIPRPQYGVTQLPPTEDDPVAEEGEGLHDDDAKDNLKEDANGGVETESEGGCVN